MDKALIQLKQAGYKITVARREILSALSCPPLTVQEIAERLKESGVKVDLVTVYRTLDLLTSLGLVRKALFHDTTARYEVVTDQEHHHHVVCEQCGVVARAPLDDIHLIELVEQQANFRVRRHTFEFFGTCTNCTGESQ
ncbi:MAG: transcriptional repressor [Chloroflexi bacterium]|nr:transcriptional repressor [Chloroflexota bacterium]